MHGLIKKYPTKGRESKLTNLWCYSTNPLQSSPLQTPHTCSSSLPFSKALLELTLWNIQQLHCCVCYISSRSWNLFPFNSIFTFGNIKCHTGQSMSSEEGDSGTCGIWHLAKKFWMRWDEWVETMSWCSCQSPHFHNTGSLRHTTSCSQQRTSMQYSLLTVQPSGAYSWWTTPSWS